MSANTRKPKTTAGGYSEGVLAHFSSPRNAGEIAEPTLVIQASNPVCGDVLKLWVRVRDGIVEEIKFKAAGCVPAIACGSCLTVMVSGRPASEIHSVTAEQIESALGGLPAASRHAAVLAADALKRLCETLGLS